MRTLHRHKINQVPVFESKVAAKELKVIAPKTETKSNRLSDLKCPIHGRYYQISTNNRPVFKGYDKDGNKLVEPYGYRRCFCPDCKREGLRSSIPEWEAIKQQENKSNGKA